MSEKISDKIVVDFWDSIAVLNTTQLRRFVKQCEKMTNTNCWWFSYRLKKIMLDLANELLRSKTKTKIKSE